MKLWNIPVDRPVATLMFLISLVVIGTVAVFELPLDYWPHIERPFVGVRVAYPGSHPLEVLREVTEPLEEELASIPDVLRVRGRADADGAYVEARFALDADLDLKKMDVREAVERVRPTLPEGIRSIRIQTYVDAPGDGTILEGRISSGRDLSESWELLDRRIRRPLERIPGVARVDLGGVEPREVRIDVDPEALRRHGVYAGELLQALSAANLDLDLGAVHGDLLRYDVRSRGRFHDVQSIRDLRIRPDGVRVRDVAAVALAEPELDYGRHLDRDFAISIEVFPEPTANTVATVDRLMARIDEMESDPDLEGIQLLVWNNAGEQIRRALSGLRNAGLFGGLLAVIVLYAFLRRLTTTAIVAVAIPFSLLVTCGAMYFLGFHMNVLTMLGLMLGVGMLVDNGVVVIENIYRRQGEGLPPREASRVGTREVGLAVLASTATTVIVWSWLFVAENSEFTAILGQVALTICLSVVCSLLISLTFIPLAASRTPPRRRAARPGFLLETVVPRYGRLLRWTLRHRLATLAGLLLLASSAVIPFSLLEKSDETREQAQEVSIYYQPQGSASKEAMEGHVNRIEDWLYTNRDALDFENVYSFFEDRWAVTRVYLPLERRGEEGAEALRRALAEGLPVIAGVDLEVGDNEQGRRRHGYRRMVDVALHGEDPEFLHDLAVTVEEMLRPVEDVTEIYGPTLTGSEEARVRVLPERARALGLSPRQIADAVAFAYRGRNLRRFQADEGELEMRIGLPEELQPGLAALVDLPIPREGGTPVPLGSVARVERARTSERIRRENRVTTTYVGVEFRDEVTTEVGRERVAAALAELALPEGYSWDWGERGRERDDALQVMLQGVIISLVVVILLMMALFESFSQPLAILITLPLALFGAFWSLWLLGYDFEIVAFVGLVILIGIVVNNGIVMVDHVNHLRRGGMERVEALVQGCGDRLRPVLMTAITTIFGLIPLATSAFMVVDVYIDSLAVAVIGGLASSTLFTLLALPVWYATVEDLGSVLLRLLVPSWSGGGIRLPRERILAGGRTPGGGRPA
ncbi:MAG: efflux RND transporter permease subunit [Acidobacteriota bacterium]|jgi:HAE1 family hydrophobic/amphiphilic exporter-1